MAFAEEYLECLRADRKPKCANCDHWKPEGWSALSTAVGVCSLHSRTNHWLVMTDMQLCSEWARKEAKDEVSPEVSDG